MTRRWFIGAGLVVPACAGAQTRAEKGKQALQDTINALGGGNFLTMQNRVESGREIALYHDKLSGLSQSTIYTEYLRAPSPGKLGMHERQLFGGKKDSSVLYLEGRGWNINYSGAHPIPAEEMERYYLSMRHNVFYMLRQRLHEPGFTVELSGHEVAENQSTDVLDFYDNDNENVTVWVNSYTHLPVRQRWYRREKDTGYRHEEITLYTRYRQFKSGISWPMDVTRERDGERTAEIHDEDVKFNVELKEDVFVLPPGVKILAS